MWHQQDPQMCWLTHCCCPAWQVLGPRRRTLVNYREKGYARFESDDEEEDGQPASKRAAKRAAADADDFDANKEEAEADDDLQGQHCKKKHKSKVGGHGWYAALHSHAADLCFTLCMQPCTAFPVCCDML